MAKGKTTKGKGGAKSKKKPGAKKPSAAKPAAKASGNPNEKIVRLPSKQVLNELVTRCFALQNDASTATGKIGELIGKASNEKNVHRGAFNQAKNLYRMGRKDPGKLWLFLCHFDDYREKLGLDDLAAEQGQLIGSGVETEEEHEAETGAAAPAADDQPPVIASEDAPAMPKDEFASAAGKIAADAKASKKKAGDDDQRDLRPRHLREGGPREQHALALQDEGDRVAAGIKPH